MPDIAALIQTGSLNPWLLFPSAVLLGALHGLEPGHSKTMMAAFIVAIRGTAAQAILLGLAATISHTAIVWAIALAGMYFGGRWSSETSEPYLQIVSATLIVAVALWMIWRTYADRRRSHRHHDGEAHAHGPAHDHAHALDDVGAGAADAHAREHADQIRRRFTDQNVTNTQIALFGLTGGLIPCPAAITVLLLCLQLKEIQLGAGLVLAFSVGLALTLVATGLAAAWAVRHARQSWPGFDVLFRNAPYVSGAIILAVGVVMGAAAWSRLT